MQVKTNSGGSCEDRCGEEFDSDNTCHCTDDCKFYGNCCSDYDEVCPAQSAGDVIKAIFQDVLWRNNWTW